MNIKRLSLIILAAFVSAVAFAQTETESSEELEHSGVEAQVDSTLLGIDVIATLPAGVSVRQDAAVRNAMIGYKTRNDAKTVNGYRIRIYFNSSRNARAESNAIIKRFTDRYPHIQAYRTYSSPNFKVTVGNFRNRVEAEALLKEIKPSFPEAFIVREKFRYPSVGMADTTLPQE